MKRYVKATEIYNDAMDRDQLISVLEDYKYDLPIGDDMFLETTDGISFNLFWHSPSINLNWYPIVEIHYNGEEVFWREGTENPDYWYTLVDTAIDKIRGL